mmetsp:Transcript_596/g.1136  ORF Transcript_596/g.1136 Transcript_596/m.1136 type:complete len:107 (+) Transcript_596:213-533(+)
MMHRSPWARPDGFCAMMSIKPTMTNRRITLWDCRKPIWTYPMVLTTFHVIVSPRWTIILWDTMTKQMETKKILKSLHHSNSDGDAENNYNTNNCNDINDQKQLPHI